MSNIEREKIFSKDYLTIEDIQVLLGLSYQMAAKKMREIKRKYDRLKLQGKCMVEDYRQYFDLPIDYFVAKKENESEKS